MQLAAEAEAAGDVPIGAVLVAGNLTIEAKNEKEARGDATAHAEMIALQQAASTTARMATPRSNDVRDERAVRHVRGRNGRGAD